MTFSCVATIMYTPKKLNGRWSNLVSVFSFAKFVNQLMSISVAILLYIGIIDGMDHLPVLFNTEKAIQKEFAFS